MEVRFDILPQDLAAFARYRAKHPDRSWASQVRSTVLAGLILIHFGLVIQVLNLAFPHEEGWRWSALIVLGQIVCWGAGILVIRRGRLRAGARLKKGHDINIRLAISPDWFSYTNQFVELKQRWTNFDKIGVTKDHAFFFVSATNGYVLPCRAFASAEDYDDFVDTARRYFHGAKAFADNPYEDVK